MWEFSPSKIDFLVKFLGINLKFHSNLHSRERILKFNLYWNFKLLISMNLKISCHLLSKYFTFISISISVCDTERRNFRSKSAYDIKQRQREWGYVLEGSYDTLSNVRDLFEFYCMCFRLYISVCEVMGKFYTLIPPKRECSWVYEESHECLWRLRKCLRS